MIQNKEYINIKLTKDEYSKLISAMTDAKHLIGNVVVNPKLNAEKIYELGERLHSIEYLAHCFTEWNIKNPQDFNNKDRELNSSGLHLLKELQKHSNNPEIEFCIQFNTSTIRDMKKYLNDYCSLKNLLNSNNEINLDSFLHDIYIQKKPNESAENQPKRVLTTIASLMFQK
jgi:hypothetical protein